MARSAGSGATCSTPPPTASSTRAAAIQLAFHAENAGRLLPGTFHYNAMSGDARHYLPLSDRLVIANRAQFGAINADGNDPTQVPFAKKYFLGGASTIRGWGRYQVSPLGGDGLPIGGNSMFAFSSELRAMLVGNLGGVAFLDAGNVWEGDWDFRPQRSALRCRPRACGTRRRSVRSASTSATS